MSRAFTPLLLLCLFGIPLWLCAQPLPKLIPYKTVAGWGYSDSNRVLRLPAIWSGAGLFKGGTARVTLDTGAKTVHCIIDEQGRYIIPPKYHWTGHYAQQGADRALNAHDSAGRLGMIDMAGNVVIPFLYDRAALVRPHYGNNFRFQQWPGLLQPFLVVTKGGKQGIIDTLGRELVPFLYDSIKPYRLGSGYYNSAVSCVTDYLFYYNENTLRYWIVQQGKHFGALNAAGKLLFSPLYDAIYPVVGKPWAVVRKGALFGAVDTAGKPIVPAVYDTLVFSGGPATMGFQTARKGSWGWHDVATGKVVPPVYKNACVYGKYGYVTVRVSNDRYEDLGRMLLRGDGKVLTPPLYNYIDLYPDSIVVQRRKTPIGTAQPIIFEEATLNKKTWKPGKWREILPPPPPMTPPAKYALVSREDRFYLPKGDTILQVVQIAGKTWEVTGYLPADDRLKRTYDFSVAKQYYLVKCAGKADMLYAAIDTALNFVLPPQKIYALLGGNFFSNTIIARRQDGKYVVTDTGLRPVSRAITRPISDYVLWRGRHYFLGGRQPNQPAVPDKELYSSKGGPFRTNCITVLNSRGKVARGFKGYCIGRFSRSENRPPKVDANGVVWAKDSLGHSGYLNLEGEIQYPAISFKHHGLERLSAQVFTHYNENGDRLISPGNRDYTPNLKDVKLTYDWPRPVLFGLQKRNAPYFANPIYIDIYGTVYADAKALE